MRTYVSREGVRPFALLIIVVGALLLLASAIKGATLAIAIAKGIPLRTFNDIGINVVNVVFNFIIPVAGGGLLMLAGNTMLRLRENTRRIIDRNKSAKVARREKAEMISRVLGRDEHAMLELIKGKDFVLQSDLMALTGYSKVKVHRLLKKLEVKGLIRRSRFGITNRVFAEPEA